MIRRLTILLLIVGCAPITFSNLQSAKMTRKGELEFTSSASASLNTFNIGFQTSYGSNYKSNLRLRLERIMIDFDAYATPYESDSLNFNYPSRFNNFQENLTHLSFGIKYQLIRNKSAIYLPLSFTKADGSNKNILKLFEPTYIHTFSLKALEINPSIKALIPISQDAKDYMLAVNLGFGMSNDFTKYVIRPELGLLSSSNLQGGIPHMSIGLSLYQ